MFSKKVHLSSILIDFLNFYKWSRSWSQSRPFETATAPVKKFRLRLHNSDGESIYLNRSGKKYLKIVKKCKLVGVWTFVENCSRLPNFFHPAA